MIDTRRWEGFVLVRIARGDIWAHGTWNSETLVVLRPETDKVAVVGTFEVSYRCTGRCKTPARKNPVKTKGRELTWKKLRYDSAWFSAAGTAAPK